MDKIEIVYGDVLKSDADIVIHQVNCQGIMGGGVALAVAKRYPNVKKEYINYINNADVSSSKELLGNVLMVDTFDDKVIANVFGQDKIKRSFVSTEKHTVTDKLLQGIREVMEFAKQNNYSIAIPYEIGCVRGGGNWAEVEPLICEIFENQNVPVKFYKF